MSDLIATVAPNLWAYRARFGQSVKETCLLFIIPGIISFFLGMLLGVILTITHKGGIKENKVVFRILDTFVNVFRAIPFVILLIFLIPFTRAIVKTAIGVKGAIIPLVFGIVPFYSRQVETALANVDEGKIEAARSMGSGTFGLIFRVDLHEAVPELARVTTITAISLVGLTTMAGAVGAGGIGSFAINYGQGQHYQDIVNVCVIVLLVGVCIIQAIGSFIAKKTSNRAFIQKTYKKMD